jgi:outer membrane protein TolC
VKFRNLAILTDGYIYRALPELEKEARKLGYEYSINVDVVPVETSAEEALANLPPKTDAVIINPLFRLTPAAFQTLVDGFSQLRIPSYSYWGRQEVELGILATITQGATMDHLARSVAVNILEILDGQKAGDLPVTFTMEEQLTINMATARATGVYPSLSILTEADLINEEVEDIERVVTIEEAAKEAVSANLDLAVANREVAAGQEAVIQERSSLLPQLGLGTTVGIIDDDRARARGGFTPERSWTGTAAATQMIYSENAWSNYTTEKHLQNSRVSGRDTLKLDIIQSAATAYLNVLRAKAIENIQKENLKLTRANLQRARVRLNVGVAGPDEVYRWESQIASSRRVVLEAESITLDTMISLNRILHRPLQELFTVKRVESDILFTGENWQFSELVDNTRNLNALKAFLIKEGISLSPELMQLEAQISARERRAKEARREFWVPTVSLSGNVKELLSEEGDGQRGDALVSLNDTEWRVGVLATFPLFTGGRKSATVRRTREELTQLRTQYDATKERIEQRILIAVNRVRASAPGVRLSRDAAETARRNLKLVSDSYTRGIKSIIDLLDAQNLVLVTNQQAANATYGFLADIISVQRSVGEFNFMLSPEQRQTRVQKLEDHMERLGIEPDRW